MPVESTIWPIDPHTRAKHDILEEYLKGWFPILSFKSPRILYLDGFAGPGKYSGGEEGSPVIAVRTAATHVLSSQFNEILFFFIERDQSRAQTLGDVLKSKFSKLPGNLKYTVQGAEFAPTLESVLANIESRGAKLAPTFAFLDPFGFSGLPMNLIARMLSYNKCEVLVTFMAGFVNRFTDEMRADVLDELFGSKDWKGIDAIADPNSRQSFLLDLYVRQLKQVASAKFVRTFEVRGKFNQLIYFLVFATKALKGLQVMKEAMMKVDSRGTFRFSDYTDANQSFLLDYSSSSNWVSLAAQMVFSKFRGTSVGVETIEEYVLAETPFVFRRSILAYLEGSQPSKVLGVNPRSRARTYPSGSRVTFSS